MTMAVLFYAATVKHWAQPCNYPARTFNIAKCVTAGYSYQRMLMGNDDFRY